MDFLKISPIISSFCSNFPLLSSSLREKHKIIGLTNSFSRVILFYFLLDHIALATPAFLCFLALQHGLPLGPHTGCSFCHFREACMINHFTSSQCLLKCHFLKETYSVTLFNFPWHYLYTFTFPFSDIFLLFP